ncbi:MAG TPA: DUF4398 domain-containing protein [Polyangiaceae bacterium]|nr:DUF4398 domain-containing protein [Polyangiaceae bacterium]
MDMLGSKIGLWALLAGAALGCGGAQLDQGRVTDVRAAVRAAEVVGAPQQPKASLELKLAEDQLAQAQRLAEDGEGDEANLLLERAKVDAELALQLARTEQEQQKAREAWAKIQPGQAPVPETSPATGPQTPAPAAQPGR